MAAEVSTGAPSHGWAPTRKGAMLHYWGLADGRASGHRPDGSPVALCHNGLQVKPDCELVEQLQTELKKCHSCAIYLKRALKKAKVVTTEPAASQAYVAKAKATVIRGTYNGRKVALTRPHRDFPGFWLCSLPKQIRRKGVLVDTDEATEVLLSEGQLQLL